MPSKTSIKVSFVTFGIEKLRKKVDEMVRYTKEHCGPVKNGQVQ